MQRNSQGSFALQAFNMVNGAMVLQVGSPGHTLFLTEKQKIGLTVLSSTMGVLHLQLV